MRCIFLRQFDACFFDQSDSVYIRQTKAAADNEGVATREAPQFSRTQPESSRPMGGLCPPKHGKNGLQMSFLALRS